MSQVELSVVIARLDIGGGVNSINSNSTVVLANLDVIDKLRIAILTSVSAQAHHFGVGGNSYGVIPKPNGVTN